MIIKIAKIFPLIISILIFFSNYLKSQENTLIFNEQFNDNKNNWDIHKIPESELNLSNEKYHMKGKMLGRAITSIIEMHNTEYEDYRISTELTKLSGIDDNGLGLIWGCNDENNEYEFVISGNGQFKVIEWKNGINKDLIAWTFNSNINKWDNATNSLKIEKQGKLIRFYINDNYVAMIPSVELQGNKIGFVINETMEVAFNYLVFENIKPENTSQEQTNQVSITSANFNGYYNNLNFGESTVLKVTLKNTSNFQATDLALIINNENIISYLEFNPITMIEEIASNGNAIISIAVSAAEEAENGIHDFQLILVNGKNEILDSETVSLKTVSRASYYSGNDYEYSNQNSSHKHNNQQNQNSVQGCTKGCSYATLGALLAVFLLIME